MFRKESTQNRVDIVTLHVNVLVIIDYPNLRPQVLIDLIDKPLHHEDQRTDPALPQQLDGQHSIYRKRRSSH